MINYLLEISTISCCLKYIAPFAISFVINNIYSKSSNEEALRVELMKIKKDMKSISMADEFAKYAKLQRKYNKLEKEFKDAVNEKLKAKTKIKNTLTSIFKFINGLLMFGLLWMYSREPVIYLPEGTLQPIQGILSWPTKYQDCISLTAWLIIVQLTMSNVNLKGLA